MQISLAKTFGRALILAGALAFACWGYLWFEELRFQRIAEHLLEEQLVHNAVPNQAVVTPHPGDVIGRIEIPRIHVSVMVLEGSDSRILRVGAGHVPGTALPGTVGNVGARNPAQRHNHPDDFPRSFSIPSGWHRNRRSS